MSSPKFADSCVFYISILLEIQVSGQKWNHSRRQAGVGSICCTLYGVLAGFEKPVKVEVSAQRTLARPGFQTE